MLNKIIIPFFCLSSCFLTGSNHPVHELPSFVTTSPKIREYENIFKYDIFDSYFEQLRTYVRLEVAPFISVNKPRNTLEAKLQEFDTLFQIRPITSEEQRQLHENIVIKLRELESEAKIFRSSSENKKAITVIDQLCLWIYTKAHLIPSYTSFLQAIEPSFANREYVNSHSLPTLISHYYAKLLAIPQFNSYYLGNPDLLDAHFDGHIPSSLYHIFGTHIIMTARVVVENILDSSFIIAPEFLSYLRALKAEGKKHLYVNLMDRQLERGACLAIENLASQDEFKEVLSVVTLDKNSDFYRQNNSLNAPLLLAREFKIAFMSQLFFQTDENSFFKWPLRLDVDSWRLSCRDILEEVHKTYFNSKESLDVSERQDFIELTLLKIVEALCKEQKPDYMNFSCRFTIDRGPSLLSLFYIYSHIENGLEISETHKLKFLSILLAPPLLSHNRPPLPDRMARIISALKILEIN